MIKGLIGFKIINVEGFIPNPVYIYTLDCPISNEPRYVGITINPKKRYKDHLCTDDGTKKGNWIKSLKKQNLKPIMNIIEVVSKDLVEKEEVRLIKEHREKYPNLKNICDGGNCSNGYTPKPRPIVGKNIKTKEIIEYNKVIDAKKDGFSEYSIYRCIRGVLNSYKGYVWSDKKDILELDKRIDNIANKKDPRSKAVFGLNDLGQKIEFESLASAERAGYINWNLIRSIKTGMKCKGYRWFYA